MKLFSMYLSLLLLLIQESACYTCFNNPLWLRLIWKKSPPTSFPINNIINNRQFPFKKLLKKNAVWTPIKWGVITTTLNVKRTFPVIHWAQTAFYRPQDKMDAEESFIFSDFCLCCTVIPIFVDTLTDVVILVTGNSLNIEKIELDLTYENK